METKRRIEFKVPTGQRETFIDITSQVRTALNNLALGSGTAVVFCPHTTAGITINESADPDVRSDMLMALKKIVPGDLKYQHAEGNSPAHIKTSLMGSSAMIRVEDNRPVLGTWQGIYLAEFDGPRDRKVWVWGL